jgi:hypothetical protein
MSAIVSNFTDGVITASDDAGHSATLTLSVGDFSLDGLMPDGRQVTVTESRGAVVGARKAARARPTFTMSATLSSPSAAFQMLVLGETSGFTSVLTSIGDAVGFDLAVSMNYGAESRSFAIQDAMCTGISIKEGDPSTISFSGEILGPVSVTGSEGTFTLIASR